MVGRELRRRRAWHYLPDRPRNRYAASGKVRRRDMGPAFAGRPLTMAAAEAARAKASVARETGRGEGDDANQR